MLFFRAFLAYAPDKIFVRKFDIDCFIYYNAITCPCIYTYNIPCSGARGYGDTFIRSLHI